MNRLPTFYREYLRLYAEKNLEGIAAMLAEDVVLRDWKICVFGKHLVLQETAHNFAAARTIAIEILSLCEGDSSVSGELHICVDGDTELFVVDVIDFNTEGKIAAIRAYLGRGNDTVGN